ncbi:MAG TPA: M50 family metallopeptidase [Pirellulales bacterium]|nr:M50 family metallopeptidase [Pirellulales bacterium]
MNKQERRAYAIFLLVILGLFAGEVCTNYAPVKLSVLLFVLFWIPLLALHESGHALMAALLGWQVEQVVIGLGRPVASFRVGSASVELKLLPLEGFARSVPRDLRLPGLKHALIYLAGPGIELLLAGAILWLVGPPQLLSHSEQYGIIVWQSLALAATVGGVLNLIPHAVQTSAGIMIPNDGLGIILSLSRPASAYAGLMNSPAADKN